MNIWIINHHALTPDMSGGTRHYDFAKELLNRGHKVTIIASSFHYSKYKEMKEYGNKEYLQEDIDGITFIWIKTPEYFGNGFSRVKNMLSFTKKVIKIVPSLTLDKPNSIIGSSVHLFAVFAAYTLSKKYNTPFLMEVRDLWPKTLIDMGISKWHPFIILLGILEKYLYKKADKIITTLPKAHEYISSLNIPKDKITWISNGTNLKNQKSIFENKLDKNKFNILYTGAHGIANNLDLLVDVAKKLKSNQRLHFTLIGDGALKENLIEKAKNYNLYNITFLNSVPKDELFEYLSSADLLYVGLKNLPLYKYGMSMNKVFDYMSAKKTILFVSSIEHNIIEIANSGIVIKEDNIEMISNAINKLSKLNQEELDEYAQNGYKYLEENYSIAVLTNKLEKLLKSEVKNKC